MTERSEKTEAIKAKKPYLYEVDLMRVVFIFGVLLNHVTSAFSGSMVDDSASQLFLNATHLMLHFTRMGFMFMTGLVLFLNYYQRDQQNWLIFWKKRYTSVGVPYLSWNAIYIFAGSLLAGTLMSGTQFLTKYLDAVLHGNQFYLYYVFVTFQLYLIFPIMVWLFKKLQGHHGWLMLISFVIELALLIFVKYEYPHLNTNNWWYLFRAYGLNVMMYQVYFMAGAFAAIHYQAVVRFLKQHTKIIFTITAILALGTIGLYFYNLNVMHFSMSHTQTAQQPYVMIYALFMVAVIFILGLKYSDKRKNGLNSKIEGFVHQSAKLSFGIYLVQTIPLIGLDGALAMIKNAIPAWVLLLLIPIGYGFVVGGSYLISLFCYRIWPFGWLIGRPQTLKKKVRVVKNDSKSNAQNLQMSTKQD